MNTPSPSPSHKRSHTSDDENDLPSDPRKIPALPQITSERLLQVFTDKSLGIPLDQTDDLVDETIYGDNERLAFVGKHAVNLAAMHCAFLERPFLGAETLQARPREILSDGNLQQWAWDYKLRERVRCLPEARLSLYNAEGTRTIFNAYCGAIFLEYGIQTLAEWIYQLVHDRHEPPTPKAPPPKKVKQEAPPSPVLSQPPMPSNPLAPAQPDVPFLPLFNQAAAARKVTVEYPAEFVGAGHTGSWNVQCVVSGIAKGSGFGRTKQAAKEQAARSAYYAMGWQ